MQTTKFPKCFSAGVIIAMQVIILLAACNTEFTNLKTVNQAPNSESQVFSSGSYITATSLQELTNKSTIVVVGKAVGTGDIINMAREVDDISKPDPNLFGIGQVYEFEISSYLKGEHEVDGAKIIYIVQVEGMIVLSTPEMPTKEEIEKARAQEKYLPIKLDSEYILFLEPLKGFSELKRHYTGVAHPWRFALVNNCAFPDSPWQDANLYFHPQPINDFIEQIENVTMNASESTEPLTYPAPSDGVSSICPPAPANPYPYP